MYSNTFIFLNLLCNTCYKSKGVEKTSNELRNQTVLTTFSYHIISYSWLTDHQLYVSNKGYHCILKNWVGKFSDYQAKVCFSLLWTTKCISLWNFIFEWKKVTSQTKTPHFPTILLQHYMLGMHIRNTKKRWS